MNVCNVKDCGAKGNGVDVDTEFVNKTINEFNSLNGGIVYFPAGIYLLGSIRLKSNVELYLESGAILKAIKNYDGNGVLEGFDPFEDVSYELYQDPSHSYFHHSLIWGENLENVSIHGNGMIDMDENWEISEEIQKKIKKLMDNGLSYQEIASKLNLSDSVTQHVLKYGFRGPKAVALKKCKFVSIKNIAIKKATDIAILLTGCEDVKTDGINVNTYVDGINIDGCKNTTISNCKVISGDDSIALKSSYSLNEPIKCENVSITNCIVRSQCLGIKLGTESNGGFSNIAISDCVIHDTLLGGLGIEEVDGGTLENVMISNILMNNVEAPLFIRLGNRSNGPEQNVGKLRNVSVNNVTAVIKKPGLLYPELGELPEQSWLKKYYNNPLPMASSVSGIEGYPVENITLRNITLVQKDTQYNMENKHFHVEDNPKSYPNPDLFGILPSYGIYLRHVKNLKLIDVVISYEEKEQRPALFFDNVKDLKMYGINIKSSGNPFQFCDVDRAIVNFLFVN